MSPQELLKSINIPGKETRLPKELFKMSLESSCPTDLSRRMRGRVDLMVDTMLAWDHMQDDLRGLESLPPLEDMLQGEIDELREVSLLEESCQIKIGDPFNTLEWHERPDAKNRWKVASEMADVLVFVEAILRRDGYNRAAMMDIFAGKDPHCEYSNLINEMGVRMNAIGMDPAEVVILKTEVNIQHRPPALYAEWKGSKFMKSMRRSLGDNSDTQIPHMASLTGVNVLTKLQSPDYAEHQDVFDIAKGCLVVPMLEMINNPSHFLLN